MFNKYLSANSSMLDKAVVISVAAMIGMNAFVLTQQHTAPVVASAAIAAAPAAA